ncbi:MAG TPA: macrolide export ATP-binding/permease MacB [Chlorobaculum sp.]|uniref:Macrolide export ATP-binding/permease protein MacB n=1 Tax=Chlorobaculum tepidum (strain ATCC 49652 / DSM 12025 / NBRC 103806 / TLS) TaxID=194439 RepID=MACB_CHLTE|nr:ABC transporter permease [Chlorobaculum tepidum]Q8KFE9.1 RecName: Full=Macrolide export ATP-binding/permease protein MacB [Chlorobaculum tepidum TLS]AAM71624.1 ABC transporter, ATP-binding protein [Chlorobaculum tepidum TLS]HBU23850.1 macrolide export ATP-binding/permease MacB [Chlorobaculum sp.]
MIEIVNVTKTYRIGESSVKALDGVSLTIGQGEFVAIMGASGSGKSTLMHILGLLDVPDTGQYRLMGKEVSRMSDDELAGIRNNVAGFVFQQFHLLSRMSTIDNVVLPCIYSGQRGDFRKDALKRLEMVGLAQRSDHRPNQMSGGEQQRVAIARALIRDPMLIFADEPTGNLDTKNSHEIMRILTDLHRQGKTIIMVTHETDIAEFADRVITMKDGVVVDDRKKQDARLNPQMPQGGMEAAHSALFQPSRLLGFVVQAFQSIASNKIRTFLSVLGILVGVASVIAMMALGTGAKASMEEQLKSMGSNLLSVRGGSAKIGGASQGFGTVTRFTEKDAAAIQAIPNLIDHVSGDVTGSGQLVYLDKNWSTSVEGVDYDYGEMRAAIPTVGRWFTREEIQERAKVAILGTTVAMQLFGDADPVDKIIKINRINFRVIGVAPAKGFAGPRDQDDVVYIPVSTAMYRVLGKLYLDGIYVEVSSAENIAPATQAIDALIRKRHKLAADDQDSFNIRDMTQFQQMLSATTQTMSMLLGSIAAISLVVGGIGIMNIMLVSVTERTREIGLRKAIGARKGDIMLQFLIESVGMTLSGGIIGIVVGVGVSVMLSAFAGWAVKTSMFSVVLATGFSVLIGLFFGLWPARKAAALKPVEALRYE